MIRTYDRQEVCGWDVIDAAKHRTEEDGSQGMWTAIGGLTALTLFVVGLMAIRRPAWAAAIIVIMFSIEQLLQSFFPVLVTRSWTINVSIGLVCLLAAIMRYLRNDDVRTGFLNPVLLLVVGIYVYQVLGWAWSPGRTFAMSQMQSNFMYLAVYLLIAPILIRDLRDFDSMMRFLLVLGTGVLLLILFNPRADFMGARYRLEVGFGESAGNPLATGRAGGTLAIAAVLMRSTKQSTIFNALRLTAFVTGMAMAVLSGSRGQSFGAGLVVILLYPLSRKVANVKQFFLVAGGFLIVVLSVYLVFDLFVSEQNYGRYTSGVDESLDARWQRIMLMLDHFVDRPEAWLVGIGPGGFSSLTGLHYTHNVPTEVLVELGLVGAVIFGSMLILITRHWRILHKTLDDEPKWRGTSAVLLGMFLYNFILSCKQGSIIGAPGPILYFVLIGRVTYTFFTTRRIDLDDEKEYFPASQRAAFDQQFDADEHDAADDYSDVGDFSDYGDAQPEPSF